MTQTPSKQWDLCRFLRTLTYFGAVPILSNFDWFQNLFGNRAQPPVNSTSATMTPYSSTEHTVFDFTQPNPQFDDIWGALDDVVMGGVSESKFQMMGASAVFSGNVSTANSGGFASVRSRNFEPPLDWSGFEGVKLRVRGDGQRYKFMLRQDTTWDSVAYCASFDTIEHEWVTVAIPFDSLIPVFRARTLPTAPPLDPGRICALQLMLSKFEYDGTLNPTFQAGAFQLQLERIQLY